MDTRRDFIYVQDLIDLVVAGARRPGLGRRLPRLLGLRLLDQGAVRRDRRGARARPGAGGRGARPRIRTTRSRSCSTRAARSRRVRLEAEDAARGGRRRRDRSTTATTGSRRRTRTSGSSRRSSRPSERARRDQRPRRRRRRVRRRQPRARAARARRGAACSSSTTCSRPSARTSRTIRASTFVEGSIADDAVLAQLEDEFDYVFHLATYHGNQSSIADPLADHENNLITTLKLFERIKGFERLRKVVYAASGCTLAPHTYGEAEAVDRGRAGAARPRQPVPDLQGRGRVLLRLLPPAGTGCRPCVRASRTSTGRARSSAPGSGAERRRRCGGT